MRVIKTDFMCISYFYFGNYFNIPNTGNVIVFYVYIMRTIIDIFDANL